MTPIAAVLVRTQPGLYETRDGSFCARKFFSSDTWEVRWLKHGGPDVGSRVVGTLHEARTFVREAHAARWHLA